MKTYTLTLCALILVFAVSICQAEPVTWSGGDINWTDGDNNSWSGGTYNNGDTAQFLGAGLGAVTVGSGVAPANTIVNAAGNYTFSGGSIGGTGTLTKSGSGTLTLSAANAYSGGTIISGGIELGQS